MWLWMCYKRLAGVWWKENVLENGEGLKAFESASEKFLKIAKQN